MKKVGIVSCYFKKNYGSMLQAYATQKFLDNNQIANETINIENNLDFKKGKKKYYLSQITNFNFLKTKLGMINLKVYQKMNKTLRKNIEIRNKAYYKFKKEFNLTAKYPDYKTLSEIATEKYSDIVVGSDQLWLPVNVVADYYTLNWVPETINKVSFATSFGISKIPEKYKMQYTNFLTKIKHLSTREKDGVNIIKNLGLEAKLVCDPTLLLTREEWEEMILEERIEKEKYILCYFLGNNIEHRKFVEKFKQITGYKIVSLNHADEYVKYSDIFADSTPYDIGPKEWLNLIKNAEIVCTDSFHCTIFSILFNKKFFDFRRYKFQNKMSTNSRLDSLLEMVGIDKKRILNCTEEPQEVLNYVIDYENVNKKVEEIREESKTWFLNALRYERGEKCRHIEIEDKELCCGCSACYSICPKQAIEMVSDKEGFLYPKINKNKCIECGLCKKVCPILNKQQFNEFQQKAYLFQNGDEVVRSTSTSGGFFSAISNYVIDNGGTVYGAIFNQEFIVEHVGTDKKEELVKFRKSKYVQSKQNDVFIEIKKKLEKGQLVCYSGTPCQVAGLQSYLQKEYQNLILIDVVCRSVPSPKVLEKYKKHILKRMNAAKIESIDFRDKSKYGYKYSMMTVKTDKGISSEGIDTDQYLRAFFSGCSIRPSCHRCQFKTQRRKSDITIWDCLNIRELDKKLNDDKGTTRLLVQTSKGEEILKRLENVKLKELTVEKVLTGIKEMTDCVPVNPNRKQFFEDIEKENLFDKYFPINIKTRLHSGIRKFLSVTGLYNLTKSIAKKILRR